MGPATNLASSNHLQRRSKPHANHDSDEYNSSSSTSTLRRPSMAVRFRSTNSIINSISDDGREPMADSDWEDFNDDEQELTLHPSSIIHAQPFVVPLFRRFSLIALIAALAVLFTQNTFLNHDAQQPFLGASAAAFTKPNKQANSLVARDNSPTDVCKRWAQQSALVNGTLYLYGGRAMKDSTQVDNTWNNNLVTVDLTKTWQIASPALSGLAQPSGPPAVSLGSLWNSYDSLFLYGGEFSDNPISNPAPNSLWEYNIGSSSWKEHSDPTTAGGVNAESAGQPIERAAEGAGFSMPSLGKGWYFGGHLDFLTTRDWSIQTPRLYLRSFIEYTFPGYNTVDGKLAGADGEWRNITSGGIQDQAGFTERADGLLVYIPGFGAQGVLLSLAGGTNVSFTQMNQVDVFDVATSRWYRQATTGSTPKIRVNPCAVTAAAIDGSSYNIYMFGGQNLIPYGEQIQYNDMWILSVPSFTWISVDMTGQSVPDPRAGHTCSIWDSQMIVVGGYVGPDLTCESPGIYVFNLSSLSWSTQFTSLSSPKTNPFSQHPNQRGTNSSSGLQGSYGYLVPEAVHKSIGGTATGAATVTAPVQTPTSGPLATGKPIVYPGLTQDKAAQGTRIGAIIAGVLAGVLLLVALYLGFCAFVYRRQLKLYRDHIAMGERAAVNPRNRPFAFGEKTGGFQLPSGLAAALAASPAGRRRSKGSGTGSGSGSGGVEEPSTAYNPHYSLGGGHGGANGGGGGTATAALLANSRSSDEGGYEDEDDLLGNLEPSFVGVVLHPRRSLRVINRD